MELPLHKLSTGFSATAVLLFVAAFTLPQEPKAHYYRPGDVVPEYSFVVDDRGVLLHCGNEGFFYNSFVKRGSKPRYVPVQLNQYWVRNSAGEDFHCMMKSAKQ